MMNKNAMKTLLPAFAVMVFFAAESKLAAQSIITEKRIPRGTKTTAIVNDRLIQSSSEEVFSNQSSSEFASKSKNSLEPESRLILPTAVQSGDSQPYGFSSMASMGTSLNRLFNVGGVFQMGYTFPFGLYLGTSGLLMNQFNGNAPFNSSLGQLQSQQNLSSPFFAGSVGSDVGYEVKLKAFSENLYSRIYFGGGLVYGLSQLANNNDFSNLTNHYLTFGNTFFYQFGRVPFFQNFMIGVDIRYFQFAGSGTSGAFFSIGRRF